MKIRNIIAFAALSAISVTAQTHEPLVIQPLFEYPVAPEEIEGLQAKSDYLMDHFWDPMNFKEKQSVDQNALNDAFSVYVAPMQWADAAKVDASVDGLIAHISKNPVLSLQFAKAAEESLYGPRAYYWNDALFIKFIDNVLRNKAIKKDRKLRYERVKKLLTNTLRGTVPPEFNYVRADGTKARYYPNGVITLIEFGDPDCDDCRMSKLKMESNVRFSNLVDKGKVNVLFIYPDPEEGWQEKLKGYPTKWHVGASEEVTDLYDLRATPSIYVIDREGRVAAKNIDIATATELASTAAEQ